MRLFFEDGTVLHGNTHTGGQLNISYKGRTEDRTSQSQLGADGVNDHVLLVKGFAEIKKITNVIVTTDRDGIIWEKNHTGTRWIIDVKQELDELRLVFSRK